MAKGKKNINIVPLGDKILVEPKGGEATTAAGIIIPDTAEKERPEIGTVLAVGGGRMTDGGEVVPMRVKEGDTVLFTKYGPDEVTIDDEDYLILSESNVLAIIK